MTISSQNRKAGPFIGNDTTTQLPFDFKVFAASDLLVVRLDTMSGQEQPLTLNTDYTVTLNGDQNSDPGGTINLVSALATGKTATVTSSLEYLQPIDITNQGGFYPRVVTAALDRLTIFAQQIYEILGRALKFPISDGSVNPTLPNRENRKGRVLAFHETTGDPVQGPSIDGVNTVAGAVAAIQTVSDSIDDVNTTAGSIVGVNTVAGHIENVDTVAGHIANVDTVAARAANVDTVAGHIANVDTVAGHIANVNTVAARAANVDTVANNIASVNSAATNMAAIIAAPSNAATATAKAAIATAQAGIATTQAGIATAQAGIATAKADAATAQAQIATTQAGAAAASAEGISAAVAAFYESNALREFGLNLL